MTCFLRKLNKLFIIIFSVFIYNAAADKSFDVYKIRYGMGSTQVKAILGSPDQSSENMWKYYKKGFRSVELKWVDNKLSEMKVAYLKMPQVTQVFSSKEQYSLIQRMPAATTDDGVRYIASPSKGFTWKVIPTGEVSELWINKTWKSKDRLQNFMQLLKPKKVQLKRVP